MNYNLNNESIRPIKTGLVLEGGGLRGMFTNGILDVFHRNGITFDGMVGVSAGVLFGCNYKSHQPGRAYRYNLKYKDDPQYMSWESWRKTGDFVNTDFSYRVLPRFLDPFDFDAYRNNPMKFYAVCTDIEEGRPVYHEIPDADGDGLTWMRASSSMPIFANPVKIGYHTYLDGGITDSIPLAFMQNKGYAKNIVIMTQPKGFRKKKAHLWLILRLFLRKYPKVADMMAKRHIMYNDQLDYIESEEQKGNILVICPDNKLDIGRLTLDEDKMKTVYEQGVKKAVEFLPQVKAFLRKDAELL